MKKEAKAPKRSFGMKSWIFPLCVGAAYPILWGVSPERTVQALRAAGHVLEQAAVPLLLAFLMMLLLNLFLTPAHVSRFLGRKAGILGILLSSAAGILSMGPVYAWYPFLASLRRKGASDFYLANFLSNRAVKPALIPLMVTYFGWGFTVIFSVFGVLNAFVAAVIVYLVTRSAH